MSCSADAAAGEATSGNEKPGRLCKWPILLREVAFSGTLLT